LADLPPQLLKNVNACLKNSMDYNKELMKKVLEFIKKSPILKVKDIDALLNALPVRTNMSS
jgi:hypothetical protein